MNVSRPVRLVAALLILVLSLSGCIMGTQLNTETADPKTISGTYDLYLYGCRYPDDREHAAFLIAPDKASRVDLYVPDTSYKITKGLPADKALAEADQFVRCGIHTVTDIRVHRIPDGSNGTIGYEILPRYLPFDVGGMDPLLVNYTLKDGKVTVYIRLFPDVERSIDQQCPGSSSGE
jgi:hypothetical protein